ncbi:WXG100 family type VII secretion target [Streptosporangium sp. CA-135522]|uniref:WXG100 family type VII secretion target n=1 Tax=Streptosporangium sp. CA-135522 TaxID=3240072 RepID=UPI003D8EED39
MAIPPDYTSIQPGSSRAGADYSQVQSHDYTKVDFDHMERTMEALVGIVKQMDSRTDQLYRDVVGALGNEWYGDVKDLFDEGKRKWDQAELEMIEQLGQAAQMIGVANANYKAAEDRNRAIWAD